MDERMERNEINDFTEDHMDMGIKQEAADGAAISEVIITEAITAEVIANETIISEAFISEAVGDEPIMGEEPADAEAPPKEPILLSNGPEPVFEQSEPDLSPDLLVACLSDSGDSETDPAVQPVFPREELPKEEKRKFRIHNIGRKLAAACLVAVLGGGSMGLGLSMGQELSKKLIDSSTPATEVSSFAFSNYTPVVSQTAALSFDTNNVAGVVQNVSDSVVSINITGQAQKTFFDQVYTPQGAGSGLVFSEDADNVYIVTNYHVIDKATKVSISIDDEKQASAKYVGGDSQADVAVISVSKADLKEADIVDYKVASFRDSDNIQIGETVLAIGNALGEGKTVTRGIVSAIKKQTALQNKTLDLIQTDAAINEGNSGGPLVDAQGLVVGINTAKLAGTGIEGMGYSIPSNTVKKTAMELLENGTVERPYLGIEVFSVTEDMMRMYDLPALGVYIKGVVPGGSAEAAGLQASDIIVGFGDIKITKAEELTSAIAAAKTGDVVKVYIYRNGKTPMMLEVTIKNMNEKF